MRFWEKISNASVASLKPSILDERMKIHLFLAFCACYPLDPRIQDSLENASLAKKNHEKPIQALHPKLPVSAAKTLAMNGHQRCGYPTCMGCHVRLPVYELISLYIYVYLLSILSYRPLQVKAALQTFVSTPTSGESTTIIQDNIQGP